MNTKSKSVPDDILLRTRSLLPKGRMGYGQARLVAQAQATRVRKLLADTSTRFSLDWIEQIPNVSVTLMTVEEIEKRTGSPAVSGATDMRKDGTYRIYINDNNSITHCRFTLAHELYHVIVGPFVDDIFTDFGYGDEDLHSRRVEHLADHFAANLLMPNALVRRAWGLPVRGLSELAALFGVSEDAMRIRLRTVGLIRSGLTKKMFYRRPRARRAGLREQRGQIWST